MSNFEHINFASIGEADLLDFIESRHHAFSKSMLRLMIKNFRSALKTNEHSTVQIKDIISLLEQIEVKVSRLISQEEESLFPFIRKLIEVKDQSEPIRFLNVKLLESSFRRIQEEHTHVSALLHSLKRLSRNYHPHSAANELLKLCFAELKEFELNCSKNLMREKDILFPKMLQLESEVMQLSSTALTGRSRFSNDD
jgi:regulator of cell morphogenesis and NO signaling